MAHRHAVGAYEREPFLCFQAHGLESGGAQGFGARQTASSVLCLAAPDKDLSDLRHLREVGLSYGASRPYDGMDPVVQGVEERLYELGPHPDTALRHPVRPSNHHRANDLAAELGPLVGGVAGDQANRELFQVLEWDAVAGERPYARVHAVDQVAALEDPVNDVACPPDSVKGFAGDLHAGAAPGDADHLLDREVVARERHGSCCRGEERQQVLRRLSAILLPHAGLFIEAMPD